MRASSKQVVGESLEADHLFEHAVECRGRIGAVGVGEVDLELGSHAGQWTAQLVGCVGDEPSLAPAGLVDSLEHVVHRAGESHDLVVACGDRDAAMEVGAADGGDLGTDLFDRAQRAADERTRSTRRAPPATSGTAMDSDVTSVVDAVTDVVASTRRGTR